MSSSSRRRRCALTLRTWPTCFGHALLPGKELRRCHQVPVPHLEQLSIAKARDSVVPMPAADLQDSPREWDGLHSLSYLSSFSYLPVRKKGRAEDLTIYAIRWLSSSSLIDPGPTTSALGQTRTWAVGKSMSGFTPAADPIPPSPEVWDVSQADLPRLIPR